ncbi:MAG: hypothetical protein J6X07_06915 [Prevotella sp.]|nr:hypothetical protein [Prevotella sp.]
MKREHMYHFTKQDSLFFYIYDTLNFYILKTNNGTDTLRFIKKNVEENYNEWYFDMNDGTVFNAHFYYGGIVNHNGHNEEISISYVKESDNQDPIMNIILAERYALSIKDVRNYSNGIYKDTIIVDDNNSQQNYHNPHYFTFEYLKWHKYRGIVEYKLSDGTIYIYKDSLQ